MMTSRVLARIFRRNAARQRRRLASLAVGADRYRLAFLGQPRPARGRILCYHSIGTPEWGVNDVTPKRFASHIEVAFAGGHSFVPASLIAAGNASPRALAITFDDALASVRNALPVLSAYGIPFTVFVVSDWADGKGRWADGRALSWLQLEEITNSGGTIGSHSVTHANFGRLSPAAAADELQRSRETISAHLGLAPSEFAIPFGRRRDWPESAQRLALGAGYTTVYAQSEDRRPLGTVPRTFVTRWDTDRLLGAALDGKFDGWEE